MTLTVSTPHIDDVADKNNIAIRVSNLSKCYQIYNAPRDRLKQFVMPKLHRIISPLKKHFTTHHLLLTTYYSPLAQVLTHH